MSIARTTISILILVGAMSNTAAQSNSNAAPGCPQSGARVFVSSTGQITLNGKTVTAGELLRAIEQLKPRPPVICYARENPEREPHPQALVALESLMSARLPIALFKDAAFSQMVDK